jgi:hypothetical protein
VYKQKIPTPIFYDKAFYNCSLSYPAVHPVVIFNEWFKTNYTGLRSIRSDYSRFQFRVTSLPASLPYRREGLISTVMEGVNITLRYTARNPLPARRGRPKTGWGCGAGVSHILLLWMQHSVIHRQEKVNKESVVYTDARSIPGIKSVMESDRDRMNVHRVRTIFRQGINWFAKFIPDFCKGGRLFG